MAGWVDRWKDGWVDGYTNGWMDGWMCGWMAGWMDGMRQEGDFFFNGHFLTTLETKFKNKTETSLEAQWLRIHLSTQALSFHPCSWKMPPASDQRGP